MSIRGEGGGGGGRRREEKGVVAVTSKAYPSPLIKLLKSAELIKEN